MKLLTSSRQKTARQCLRKHHLRYGLGYRRLEDEGVLFFGNVIHDGLERWLQAMTTGHSTLALTAAMLAAENLADPYEAAKALVMLEGYHARWKEQGLRVLAVEQEFTSPLLNPATGAASRTWLQAGKLDAVVADEDGRAWVMEHKTSSEDVSVGSPYWTRLRMDGQVSTYYDGAAALGYDVHGVIYDVLAKPRQKPYKATPEESRKYTKAGTLYAGQRERDETPEEYRDRLREAIAADPNAYYQRAEVVRLEAEMADFRFDLWQLGRILHEAELSGRAPKNSDSCFAYNRPCPFFLACSGEASLDNPTLYERVENVHPELSASEAPRRVA